MVNRRMPIWRVRVKKAIEDWIEIEAPTAETAEIDATKKPFVISVFSRSAIPGGEKIFPGQPRAIEEDTDA